MEPVSSRSRNDLRLDGPKLYLRLLQRDDITDDYERWMNDPEVNRFLESRYQKTTKNGLEKFLIEHQNDTAIFCAIIAKDKDRHIGNIKLGSIDWRHERADIGIMIGDKRYWSGGYGTESIALLSDYAFSALYLRKIIAGCYSSNIGSVKAFGKVGFHIEG